MVILSYYDLLTAQNSDAKVKAWRQKFLHAIEIKLGALQ
jgi:hypothetical protein